MKFIFVVLCLFGFSNPASAWVERQCNAAEQNVAQQACRNSFPAAAEANWATCTSNGSYLSTTCQCRGGNGDTNYGSCGGWPINPGMGEEPFDIELPRYLPSGTQLPSHLPSSSAIRK